MLSIDAFKNNPNPVLDIRFHLTDRDLLDMRFKYRDREMYLLDRLAFNNEKIYLDWVVSNWPFAEFYDINPFQIFVQWDSIANRCHVISFDAKSTVKPHVDLGGCIEHWIEQIDFQTH